MYWAKVGYKFLTSSKVYLTDDLFLELFLKAIETIVSHKTIYQFKVHIRLIILVLRPTT